ncbi:MAG TPA: hypothetical protein VJS20_03400 [Gemmatimonadales bacterium]|nr:hypothetical protein [Gemmatimonadales bacterium]
MTSTMLRRCLTAALAAVALAPVNSVEAVPGVNPFAGSWSGTWSVVEVDVNGTFDWTVSDAGRLTGRVSITGGDAGAIVGHVGADGTLNLIGYAPADNPLLGNGTAFRGTAAIDAEGRLLVSATRTEKSRSIVGILERN